MYLATPYTKMDTNCIDGHYVKGGATRYTRLRPNPDISTSTAKLRRRSLFKPVFVVAAVIICTTGSRRRQDLPEDTSCKWSSMGWAVLASRPTYARPLFLVALSTVRI